MRIDPVLASLRTNPAPLTADCAAVAAGWERACGEASAKALAADLARYGTGAPLAGCAALGRLLDGGGGGSGAGAVQRMLQLAAAALRSAPLGQLRLPHFSNGVLHSLTLLSAGRASLSLALVDGDAWSAGASGAARRASFPGGELHLRVLAGGATGRRAIRSSGALRTEVLALDPGQRLSFDCATEALVLDAVAGSLVTLRLHRRPARPVPVQELDLASGAVVHQSAARQGDSRTEMAMALLGRMGRTEAVPVIAEIAGEGEPALRWQAIRECLALDAGQGFALLLKAAADPADPLYQPARQLADTLAARHPALAALREELLCPA
jgi:hypothetical protein